MGLRIRSYRPPDGPELASALDATWRAHPIMRHLHAIHGPDREAPRRRTLVADDGDAVVGAATVVDSRRHASRYGLVLDVVEGRRGSGIGSALLAAAARVTAGEPRPFRVQVCADDPVSLAFLGRHGFRALAGTWVGWLDPLDGAALAGGADLLPAGCRLLRAPAVDRPTIARALFRWYRTHHAWDPPTEWTGQLILDHFAGDDLVPGSEVAVVEAGAVIGAATLIRPPLGGDQLYLVHIGPVDPAHPAAGQVTAALLRACLERAAAISSPVQCEVDDSNGTLWALLGRMGLPVRPALLTVAAMPRPRVDGQRTATPVM